MYYIYCKLKNDMANILKTEKKVAVISMLAEGTTIINISADRPAAIKQIKSWVDSTAIH